MGRRLADKVMLITGGASGIGLATADAGSCEIAMAVLFLASDESSYVTGAERVVDGGCTAR